MVIHPSQLEKQRDGFAPGKTYTPKGELRVTYTNVTTSQDTRFPGWKLHDPPACGCACGKCDLCLNHGGYKIIAGGP
jgi:hypothetical protein